MPREKHEVHVGSIAYEECKAHFKNGSPPDVFMAWWRQQDLGEDRQDWDVEGVPLMMESEDINHLWGGRWDLNSGKTLLHWALDYNHEHGPVHGDILDELLKATEDWDMGQMDSTFPGNSPLHIACLTAQRYCKNSGGMYTPRPQRITRQQERQRTNVQNANANVMRVFRACPSVALEQNYQLAWSEDGMTGHYPLQYMFSRMPDSPSGFAVEDFRAILNEMGRCATKGKQNEIASDIDDDDDDVEDNDDDVTPTIKDVGSVGGTDTLQDNFEKHESLLAMAVYRNEGHKVQSVKMFGKTIDSSLPRQMSSDAEVRIILEAFPGAALLEPAMPDHNLFSRILDCHPALVPTWLALNPSLAKATTPKEYEECYLGMGGYTLLHLHVFHSRYLDNETVQEKTRDDHMLNSEICYQLVAAGTPLEAKSITNDRGDNPHETALEMAEVRLLTEQEEDERERGGAPRYAGGYPPPLNYHLLFTLQELTVFNNAKTRDGRRLGNEHFRHWTTRSHGWCPPTARLTALTVLLVGETYTRELLPRLPMDAWYKILSMIPRYELRMGQCTKEEEDGAQEVCDGIVHAAKAP